MLKVHKAQPRHSLGAVPNSCSFLPTVALQSFNSQLQTQGVVIHVNSLPAVVFNGFHNALTPFSHKKRALFDFEYHCWQIIASYVQKQAATSSAISRNRAQIRATRRKSKKCSFDNHNMKKNEQISDCALLW